MSRTELADAIDQAGLAGHPSMPNTVAAGQGWPEWVRTTYTDTTGGCEVAATDWVVWVVLPSFDTPAAADLARDRVAQHLHEVAAVDTCEPALITVTEQGGNPIPALRYTVRTTP